jgi:thioredoxin 2
MNATKLDDRGVIEICPNCGQKNRVPFSALGGSAKCGRCKTEIPTLKHPIEIDTEENFDSLLKGTDLPVLVDFWAEWCGPCKMMAPELERVSAASAARFVVGKVETQGVPSLAQRFAIHALPTLVVFMNGAEVARMEGARPAAQIAAFVANAQTHAATARA